MNKTTLVVLAAGLGSRYAGGIKQLEPVGPSGELIIDYSVYDALEAGFDKIVFIIREDIRDAFDQMIGNRLKNHAQIEYVYQHLDCLPQGFKCPEDRAKPWGHGHAVVCCKGAVNEPFAVINADDFYGKQAFVKLHDYLADMDTQSMDLCMAGFVLKNTLSDNGTVNRGVCDVDENGLLTDVVETYNIRRVEDGRVLSGDNDAEIDENCYVSMNMWGCPARFIDELEEQFIEFLEANADNIKAEFLLPAGIDKMIKDKTATCKLLSSEDKWFGVTYAEDKQAVKDNISSLVAKGVYPNKLWK